MFRHAVHSCAVCKKFFAHDARVDYVHLHFRFCSAHCLIAFTAERRTGADRRTGERRRSGVV